MPADGVRRDLAGGADVSDQPSGSGMMTEGGLGLTMESACSMHWCQSHRPSYCLHDAAQG